MPCRADRAQRARAAARALRECEGVVGADAHPPDEGAAPCWSVFATIDPATGGATPPMQAELAGRGLTTRCRERNGLYWLVATV